MVSKGSKKGTTRFVFRPENGAHEVQLAGDFNGWEPQPMQKRRGEYVSLVKLTPGEHEYKFVVDGDWRPDPDHAQYAVNQFGTVNSVAHVE